MRSDEPGGSARLARLPDDEDQAVTFCEECAEREFGEPALASFTQVSAAKVKHPKASSRESSQHNNRE